MKVLDLQCTHLHVFEGWFASEDDFQSQLLRQLISCPMCGDLQITKKLSAPRLNLTTTRQEVAQPASASVATEPALAPAVDATPNPETELQAALLKVVRHVVANTEDVGSGFAEEARKMHYGEAEHRNIRGHATPQEREELIDEGIPVLPLPMPESVKETLQ